MKDEKLTLADNQFINGLLKDLDNLMRLPANWDGNNSKKPNPKIVKKIGDLFSHFPNINNPAISANSEGEPVLEWCFKNKKLTIYFTENKMNFIKVSGEKVEDMEMEEGAANFSLFNKLLSDLLSWLVE